MRYTPPSATARRANRHALAFTLIELLVVIAIIGLLMAVGIPAFKGFGKSNAIVAAQRQMLDDLQFARQRAIAEHTDVYMVFMMYPVSGTLTNGYTGVEVQQITNLLQQQLAAYALFAKRSVGEQPGQQNPRYLTAWRRLPDGIFIAASKFNYGGPATDGVAPFQTNDFPFPTSPSTFSQHLPFLQFNYLGQLLTTNASGSEVIPLARGSIFANADLSADVLETPPGNSRTNSTMYNHIVIDGLTGRAKVEKPEIQ